MPFSLSDLKQLESQSQCTFYLASLLKKTVKLKGGLIYFSSPSQTVLLEFTLLC